MQHFKLPAECRGPCSRLYPFLFLGVQLAPVAEWVEDGGLVSSAAWVTPPPLPPYPIPHGKLRGVIKPQWPGKFRGNQAPAASRVSSPGWETGFSYIVSFQVNKLGKGHRWGLNEHLACVNGLLN